MFRRTLVILLVGLSLSVTLRAQTDRGVRIHWQAPKDYPVFDKAGYPDADHPIPVFSTRILATPTSGAAKPSITISKGVYEPVPEAELKYYQGLDLSHHHLKAWLQTERNQPFIRYELNPVIKNPSSGRLERLISFEPEISWTIASQGQAGPLKGVTFANNSVLASGRWYKIAISDTGIYKITYEDLTGMGFENPGNIRLFGNGGKQLPFDSGLDRTDDLVENPVYLFTGTDGTFGPGDYLLFYAKGIVHWQYDSASDMFVHSLHQFSDEVYYFLTDTGGSGLRINQRAQASEPPNQESATYDYYIHREKDSVNLIKSGRQWVWKYFNIVNRYEFLLPLGQKVAGEPVRIKSSLLVRSTKTAANSSIVLQVNNETINTFSFAGVNTGNYEALYATQETKYSQVITDANEILLAYQFAPSNPAAVGWIDYFDVNTRSQLSYQGSPLYFRDKQTVGAGAVTRFTVSGTGSSLQLWDVTSLQDVHGIQYSTTGNQLSFVTKTDQIKEFVVFDPASADIPKPVYTGTGLGEVENQNLHAMQSPEMLIIVQPELREQAEELAAIHLAHDGLKVEVVEPQTIYNEFSSGIQDPTAFRDFLRMLYLRNTGSDITLKYVLLFGDGTYNNKLLVSTDEFRNYLPTYQSDESLYPTRSYVTDDFFGLMDEGEDLLYGMLDIGVGRFPVNTPYQASIVVEKVRTYLSAETYGDWRNLVCFIGDDEDGNAHMRDANTLADLIDLNYPAFNIDKIFLDAFQQVVTAAGETYPEVNRAINNRIAKGALIMNYLGHGSEKGLAHENILTGSDIRSWTNEDKLPLFMTATCEFSRFDDHEVPSAGEDILLNANGGGIGLFTTTRLVYSSPNFRLNREFYDYAFERDLKGKYRFGDLMRLTKNAVGVELNKLNFTLLADPAIKLNFPEHKVIMTQVNNQPVAEFSDTLKALSRVSITGYVADVSFNKMDDFQGIVYPTVYDKTVTLTTLNNDGGVPMEFQIQNNILFKGKASVTDGEFTYDFIVPKDIGYNIGPGRFSFYATNGESDGAGVNRNVRIGGSADSLINDNAGPQVRLFMNDTTFVYGGTTNEHPVLLAKLLDDNGINTTGNGIGHDITAIIDDNNQDIIILNDYYESNLDDYRGGTVRYPVPELDPGTHRVKLKVWDILNNSTETELEFEVNSSEQVVLKNLLNYPNPFTTQTAFYFEHNQSGAALDAQIQIYTVSGKLVKTFDFLSATETQVEAGKFRVGPIYWDGTDQYGDRIGRGTYFYRVKIRTPNGTQEAYQKLVKL